MRLINVKKLEREIEQTHPYAGLPMAAHICTLELLQYSPTVDAVPVVRCRDCASFEEIGTYPDNEGAPFGYCHHWDYEQGMSPNQVDGNDFCSYGKRMEKNNE